MIERFNVRDVQLWSPVLGRGIPFTFLLLNSNKLGIYDEYIFDIRPEEAEYVLPNGKHMSLIDAKIVDTRTNTYIKYINFSFNSHGCVEISRHFDIGYHVDIIPIEFVYLEGDTYLPDD